MAGKINPRCHCTMQEMGEDRWIKPYDGYCDPDPNCKECNGEGRTGECELIFGEGAEKTYTGVCPVCGECNGVYFQYPDTGPPDEDPFYDKHEGPKCVNKDCSNCRVNPIPWVDETELGRGEI